MTILVTGGSGFIGSNFIRSWFNDSEEKLINLDKLTYAGNNFNLFDVNKNNYIFIKGDIANKDIVDDILLEHKPRIVINFAAESHVDNSIENPDDFIHTNIYGTYNLLRSSSKFIKNISQEFRFIHISTDEVYGSLEANDSPFKETNRYMPNSPYSATKASSDHLVRSWYSTYKLPTIITNCSNNYGPFQFPEKLIPKTIINALRQEIIPIYGDGSQIRDWLYVDDHCEAIKSVIKNGEIGEVYNIGGNNEIKNIDVTMQICDLLDEFKPSPNGSYTRLIKHVTDRPGHDKRYSIDCSKIKKELNWLPKESFDTGLIKTVHWYIKNSDWIKNIESGLYREF